MTEADVKKRIKNIKQVAESGDHEAAHVQEDTLLVDVLKAIADDDLDAARMNRLATAALRSLDLKFERYCA